MLSKKLRILILKHLAEQPRSGYSLIKEIEKHTSWKPSYGSMYPALEHLKDEGLVTFKEVGRKKIYTLTKKGEQESANQHIDDAEAIETMDKLHRLVTHISGIKGDKLPVMDMMRRAINPDAELKKILKKSYTLKLEFARLMKTDAYKKNCDRICEMFDEMTQELKKMK
jgi:DNA-binding PadR family transcriptional regulator